MNTKTVIYRINYINHNQVYELYAKHVSTDVMLGFMSISDIMFDIKDALVIDPIEEQLKAEFQDVEVLHIPLTHVLKVEEVKNKQSCKIRQLHPGTLESTMKNQPGTIK